MKYFLFTVLFAFSSDLIAQKNVAPVSESTLTGISLPAGSKKDSRMMSTAAAKILLEMESDKAKATLSETEVLIIPVTPGGFNKDSLVTKLKALQWSVVPLEADDEYSWLMKDKRTVIAYFSVSGAVFSLYFAEAAIPAPKITAEADPKPVQQPVSVAAPVPTPVASPVAAPETTPVKESVVAPVAAPVNAASQAQPELVAPAKPGTYTFYTTNFDDGWTGTVKEDWVQAVKGSITVLLHYPTTAIDVSSYDYKTIAANAWNTLVSGRYGNLQNFLIFSGTLDYERPYYVSGDVTDNATGKNVHVVLFKKGDSGWIEIIAPDRSTFIQSFGIDISKVDYYADSSIWESLKKLSWYNRFAISPSDIRGKWTSNFTGIQQYVNAYTGANAGMDTYSSSQTFEFEVNGGYKWEISVASGFVGNIKFQNVKSAGVATQPNNWQIYFSDLEGKPKTYNAYFSCIKGARILWLEDSSYPTGYTAYGKM